jgi:hypothetical protein
MPLLLGDAGTAGLAIILGVMVAVALGMLAFQVRQSREKGAKVRLLSDHLKGRILPGRLWEVPSVGFKLGGYAARLDFGEDGQAFTRVSVRIPPTTAGRLIIVPESLGGQFHRLFGVHDIEIGDRRFDHAFIIQAQPEAVAHRVFDPAQREAAMAAVRRLAAHGRFMLRAERGSLEIQYHDLVLEAALLLDLVRAASDLVPCLLSNPHTGIEYGESAELMDGHCPICTTTLEEPLIRCPRCGAPHHRECWEYFGRCAVYACEPKAS